MGEAKSAEGAEGEWGKDERAMGEPEKDNSPAGEPEEGEGPVNLRPGERPSQERLGPVPKRSRECEAQGFAR
ncbi:MAG: hypothetical protein ACE5H7_04420 [Acidiferrobacterales bacterium]